VGDDHAAHVTDDDGARLDQRDLSDRDQLVVHGLVDRAEQVPAAAERIGSQRDEVLAVEHEQREVVRDRVREGDGHQ